MVYTESVCITSFFFSFFFLTVSLKMIWMNVPSVFSEGG